MVLTNNFEIYFVNLSSKLTSVSLRGYIILQGFQNLVDLSVTL